MKVESVRNSKLSTPAPEKWTIRNLLQWTTVHFEEKGISSPRLNAEVLLAHVLSIGRLALYLQYEREISAECRAGFRHAIQKRLEGNPLQYITGVQEFWSLAFSVNNHTLIPRPESEHVIEAVLALKDTILLKENECLRVLDIGTGCGNLAITLSKEIQPTWILATDLSYDALVMAQTNAKRLLTHAGVFFVRADLLEGLHKNRARFHIILSNPPYIPSGELETLEPEVRDHEPRSALDGGEDGLHFQRRIVQNAYCYLYGGGYLILEIGQGQAGPLITEMKKTGEYHNYVVHPDFAGRDRVLTAQTVLNRGHRPMELHNGSSTSWTH